MGNSAEPPAQHQGKRVVVVGLGNIGSHLASYLARLPAIGEMALVDPDQVEARNVEAQDYLPSDIGRPKAVALAHRLRRIRPELRLRPMVARVEDLPLGCLECDAVASGLDSIGARIRLNGIVWRLGRLWVDTGVHPDMFTRLSVFDPKANGSCYECALDERHYTQTAQRFACLDRAPRVEHTGAPACLGALAAAQAAIELKRLLAGETSLAVGCDVIFRAGDYNLTRSAIRRNPQCRFDHQVWEIVPLARPAREVTLGDVFALGAGDGASGGVLSVWERLFTTALECRECCRSQATLRLLSRTARMRCRRCGSALETNGFDLRSDLDSAALPARVLSRFLPSFGIRDGDVVSVGTRHYRIGART